MHYPRRQGKIETDKKTKRKEKEQRRGTQEHLYKTGVGSGAL